MNRILVVEDEPAIALGLEDDLKVEGYEVEVVSDSDSSGHLVAGAWAEQSLTARVLSRCLRV